MKYYGFIQPYLKGYICKTDHINLKLDRFICVLVYIIYVFHSEIAMLAMAGNQRLHLK